MNCLFNNFYWNKPSKIFPGHITSSCLLLFYWSWIRDSNPWPRDYKSRALPTELIQQMSLSFQSVNHTFTLIILDYSSRRMTLPFWYTEVITNPHLPAAVHILTCYWWPPHRNSNCHSTFFIFGFSVGACRWTRTNYLWRMKPSLIHISFTGKSLVLIIRFNYPKPLLDENYK